MSDRDLCPGRGAARGTRSRHRRFTASALDAVCSSAGCGATYSGTAAARSHVRSAPERSALPKTLRRKTKVNSRNFFAELKRRNVYRAAVAYAVVAWLLLQAASILFPTFEAPPWVMKVFVAVIVLGFPVALVFAWAFEITPEGIKREEDVAPNESITPHTGRKIVGITIV